MIYLSIHSNKFLWYLILRRKENEQIFIIWTAAKDSWKQARKKTFVQKQVTLFSVFLILFTVFLFTTVMRVEAFWLVISPSDPIKYDTNKCWKLVQVNQRAKTPVRLYQVIDVIG